MPDPPKHKDRRQNRQHKDLGVVVSHAEAIQMPPARLAWRPETRLAWSTYWSSEPAKYVLVSDLTALFRLFDHYDVRTRYTEAVMRTGNHVVLGSQDQEVLNPLLKRVDALEGSIVALEDRFGLSPLGRLKLGVTFGDAHRSLSDLNAGLGDPDPDESGDDEDPRLRIVNPA